MKTHLFLGLVVILAAGHISVRGGDNPAQAAAREALAKFLMSPSPAQTNSLRAGKPAFAGRAGRAGRQRCPTGTGCSASASARQSGSIQQSARVK